MAYPNPDPPQRPLSPWAARYDRVHDKWLHDLDKFRHSTFAPEYPRLHPRYYADNPSRSQRFHGFAHGFDEDRLFYSEHNQKCELKIDAWQVGPLNRYVSFGPRFPKILGGHSRVSNNRNDRSSVINDVRRLTGITYATNDEALLAVYRFERIKVDEPKWFRFFRRSRWWDPEQGDDPILGLRWSVDDPRVWAQLSIILELANRMLNALVDDEHDWLRTILFGRLDYWRNVRTDRPFHNARVLLSREADRLACRAQNTKSVFDLYPKLPDWRFRLETLLKDARWTFKYDPGSEIMGVTDPGRQGLIALDITFIRLLCGDQITLSERCLLTILLTITVLHELMHHINFVRMTQKPPDVNNFLDAWNDEHPEDEPFVDYDGQAEIGSAFEKAIFGGIVEDKPSFGLPITLAFMTWPGFRGNTPKLNLKHPSYSPTHKFKTWRIPSTWASTMLSSSFWDDPTVSRKSDNRFHLAPLFVSYTPNEEPAPTVWGAVDVDRDITYSSPLEMELVNEWDERIELWAGFRREWFNQGLNTWSTTPWSDTGLRPALNAFVRAFRIHDELGCGVEADSLVKAVPWEGDAAAFQRSLPPHDNILWVYSVIGLLMLAACPIRKGVLTKESSEYVLVNGGSIRPSVMAQGVDPENQVIERRTVAAYTAEIVLAPPVVGNLFRGIPAGHATTQFDYLNMASNLVEYFGRARSTVCGPWLFEILRCGKLLQDERVRLRNQYPKDHETKWAYSWDFQVPEYVSPNVHGGPHAEIWVRWDPDANLWAGVDFQPPRAPP
ncbi:hypothetical protein F4859DRAFT_229333 [Xylaria cf. heliscus]|nr:hypothetical protein F4859DRAFT_229333 [Xylaria cf. heliscus]